MSALTGPSLLAQQATPPDTVWREVPAGAPAPFSPPIVVRVGGVRDQFGFGRVTRIAAGPNDQVAVLDTKPEANPIAIFARDGSFIRGVGSFGEGPGQFRTSALPTFQADGALLVLDPAQRRITRWGTGPSSSATTISTMKVTEATSLGAVASAGSCCVLLGEHQRPPGGVGTYVTTTAVLKFKRFDLTRQTITSPPTEVALPAPGSRAPFAGRTFRVPLPDGRIATVHSDRLGVAVWGIDDRMHGYWHRVDPVAVSPAERREEEAVRAFEVGHVPEMFRRPTAEVPPFKQIVTDAYADATGRLWLRRAAPGIKGRSERTFRDGNGQWGPARTIHDGVYFSVFTMAGAYLGDVKLPDDLELFAFGSRAIWAVREDADGVQSLVRFDMPAWRSPSPPAPSVR